jgi:hypothetical protein
MPPFSVTVYHDQGASWTCSQSRYYTNSLLYMARVLTIYMKKPSGKKIPKTSKKQTRSGTKFGTRRHQAVTELPKLKLHQETDE